MKYICIDDGAVAELVSGRQFQSIDFEEGADLIKSLSGIGAFMVKSGRITHFQDPDGVFICTAGAWKKKKYLLIDCEQSQIFSQLPKSESLVSFQKLLRFCTKLWTNGIYNHSEKVISGTSKAVLFPFNYSTSSGFRIAIEREPAKERLTKRDMHGHFLLVYKSGTSGADSAKEIANDGNLKKAFDRLPDIYREIQKTVSDTSVMGDGSQLATTDLGGSPPTSRPAHLPFEQWGPLLTNQQRKFIQAPVETAHRLQGPAGTGKTLSLVLRTIHILRAAERNKRTCHALLVTHSEATREAIRNTLSVVDHAHFQDRDRRTEAVALSVETLASLCANFLSQSISETEFIDRDAQDSKVLQELYIEQAISSSRKSDFSSFKQHLSAELRGLFEGSSDADLAPLFQHEISVLIKGRAGESFDVYKNCPSLSFGLPVRNEADKGFIFTVFQKYQGQLAANSQFDTDDVVISAVGQLDTPIWRRRREREGYDFIAIDETHLFNINELQVFHHFSRDAEHLPISFTVDQAQAVGDRGWDDASAFSEALVGEETVKANETTFTAVFRSSPDIRDFCHSVLASGAALFSSFPNTLSGSQSTFTRDDERRSQAITYDEYPDDETMFEAAFAHAEDLLKKTESTRPEVLITSLSEDVIKGLRSISEAKNKPVTILDRRGDYVRVEQAEKAGHIVLGHADFVGGLEFNVVVIVGVDKGRVPFEGESEDSNSRSFLSYVAHNRLYVAASRAKYALSLLGVKSRGPSKLLDVARSQKLIKAS